MNKSFEIIEQVDRMLRVLTESKLSRKEHLLNIVNLLKINRIKSNKISFLLKDIKTQSDEVTVDFELLERGLRKTLTKKGNKKENCEYYFESVWKSLNKRKFKDDEDESESELEEPSILPKKVFKKELFSLQVELLKLQEWLSKTNKTVIVVFEGRDSAGKGSTIKKFTENMNPRFYKIITLGIPTPDERANWWKRYEDQIEKGKVNLFDRSWYNRGLVEPVMGYGTPEEYEDFMENVQGFEESLVADGDFLFKLWFSIDKETQAQRFEFRQKSPLKYWKYSKNDEKMQEVWDKFTEYKEKLFDKTSTVNHPWVVLDSNDKKISGLNAIRYVLQNIPYENKNDDLLDKEYPEAMTVLRPNI